MNSPWNADRVDTLRRMWGEGFSFAEIASELACGLTRNACIGKATRLGLRAEGTKRKVRNGVKAIATNRDGYGSIARRIRARAKAPAPVIVDLPIPYNFLGVSLLDLQSGQCRYPQGDSPILFCGNPADAGSWCAHCRKIVFSKIIYSDQERREHGRTIRAAQRAKRRTDQARAA